MTFDSHYGTIRIITTRSISPLSLTALSYALLGLLHQKPASGYDLRKIFTETPMAHLSDSPGAIYPALRRLEERKLIAGVIEHGAGLRQRKLLRITPAGVSALKHWLKAPIEPSDIANRLDQIMLRFAFFDHSLGPKATLQFLQSYEAQLKLYIPKLRQYMKSSSTKMTLSASLSLQNGALGYQAQLKWASLAMNQYKRKIESL